MVGTAPTTTDHRTRRRRPKLLPLVHGVFLVLLAAMSAGLAVLVGAHFSAAIVGTTVAHDRALIGLWADANVDADDLRAGGFDATRRNELEAQLTALAARSAIALLEIRDASGAVLLTTTSPLMVPPVSEKDLAGAVGGQSAARIVHPDPATTGQSQPAAMIAELLPLVETGGTTVGVVALWRDAQPLLAEVDAARRDVFLVVSVAALTVACLLTLIFGAAHRRLVAQNAALVESTRRDPLTGMFNHGTAVAALAERLEIARGAGASLAIALIDVDSFRLLNETHGHDAGDAVLLEVSRPLGELASAGCVTGRYGPDEFIVIGPPVAVETVTHVVDAVRQRLRDVSVRFGDSDPLPVTVSVGLATFPMAARSVTDLLVAAANALNDAKTSGGDTVRSAEASAESTAQHPTFNALQGLIFAVDTKDRYTRRHAEDVARYAVFLGRELGLSPAELEQLRLIGLLHDVGKVGIPDTILRKPSGLRRDERAIVEQHVALGDLIVRDVPDLDSVRAGVRYHHERWDGGGYLEQLKGEEIPLVARIVAVCDAFSAMTTTRPYRKALTVSEALKRLGDAAGSQLDERLVVPFITAMETLPDAPQPEEESSRARLWVPSRAALAPTQ